MPVGTQAGRGLAGTPSSTRTLSHFSPTTTPSYTPNPSGQPSALLALDGTTYTTVGWDGYQYSFNLFVSVVSL
jgi:hypothetical protein